MQLSRWLRTDVLSCAGILKVATLPRVRTLDHANPRKGLRGNPAATRKVATLPRVQSLDHTNPRRGLRGGPKSCNFTSCSRARPRQSIVKGLRGRIKVGKKMQLYLAFARSTTPIHGKGCTGRIKVATLPRVRAFDHANLWQWLRVTPTSCNFTWRFARSTTPIHGKGCIPDRWHGAGSGFRKKDNIPRCR